MSEDLEAEIMRSMEKRVCMAMDAFRWCMGINTKNYSIKEIREKFFEGLENVPESRRRFRGGVEIGPTDGAE